MADIDKINGVDVGDIDKIDGVDKGDVNTLHSGEVPASQTDPSVSALTNYQFDSGDARNGATAYSPDDSTLGVAYCDGGNSSYPTVRLGTLSGTTITWGDEVVCESAACGPMGLAYDTNVDRYVVAWQVSASGNSPKVAGASVESGPVIGSLQTSTLSQVSGKGDGKLPEGNMCIFDPAGSRTLLYFARSGSHNMDQDDIFPITFDDVGSDNSVTINSATTVSNSGVDYTAAMTLAYDATANKVVGIFQGRGSPYKVNAFVVSGTGTTVTANTAVEYANTSIMCHNGDSGGSSLSRHRLDNAQLLVHVNGVNHCLIFDDDVDDYVLTGFTVSGTTPTWSADDSTGSSLPVKSNGIGAQFGNAMNYGGGLDSGGTSEYATYGLFGNSGRNRIALAGPAGTSDSDDMLVVGANYVSATGYNFIGNYLTFHSESLGFNYGDVDINNNSWYSKHALIAGQPIDDSGGYILAFDPGVGLRTAANGIFSLGNATLPASRSRLAGFGQSRIASMTAGGNNTSGTPQLDTDEYNGSVLIAGGNMAIARHSPGGCGTLGAGFVFSGTGTGGHAADSSPLTVTTGEEYDGSSFSTSGASSSMGGDGVSMAGVQTDALGCGGYITAYRKDCESYNGSSWSSEADGPVNFNYARMVGRGQGDALHIQGSAGSGKITGTYQYNGTAWSTLNSTSNGNNVMQAAGISTDAVSTGGGRVANNDSEIWDGTSWATGPTNANSRYSPSDAVDCNGTFASVFFAGGTGSGNDTGTSVVVHLDR